MLIVFYALLVWLKVIIGTSIVFLWLWIARDRGAGPIAMTLHAIAAVVVWAAPWVAFLTTRARLFHGRCGLRQGVRDCDLVEYLWTDTRWYREGLMLDLLLLVGIFYIIFRARRSSEASGSLGYR